MCPGVVLVSTSGNSTTTSFAAVAGVGDGRTDSVDAAVAWRRVNFRSRGFPNQSGHNQSAQDAPNPLHSSRKPPGGVRDRGGPPRHSFHRSALEQCLDRGFQPPEMIFERRR